MAATPDELVAATDLLGQTAPRFPVRTPEAFVALVAPPFEEARLLAVAHAVETLIGRPELPAFA